MSWESKKKKREEVGRKAGSIRISRKNPTILNLSLVKLVSLQLEVEAAKKLILERKPAMLLYPLMGEGHGLSTVGYLKPIMNQEDFAVEFNEKDWEPTVRLKGRGVPVGSMHSLRVVIRGDQVKARLVYFKGKPKLLG